VGVVVFQTTGAGGAPLPPAQQGLPQLFQFRGWTYQTFPARVNNYTYGQADLTTVVDGAATPVDLDLLPEGERIRTFDLVTDVRLWHRHQYIRRLAEHAERVAPRRGRIDRVVVLVSSADLSPLDQRVTSETCVYVVREGEVAGRGCFAAEAL